MGCELWWCGAGPACSSSPLLLHRRTSSLVASLRGAVGAARALRERGHGGELQRRAPPFRAWPRGSAAASGLTSGVNLQRCRAFPFFPPSPIPLRTELGRYGSDGSGGRRGRSRRGASARRVVPSASGREERAAGMRDSASRRPLVAGSTVVIFLDDVARRGALFVARIVFRDGRVIICMQPIITEARILSENRPDDDLSPV